MAFEYPDDPGTRHIDTQYMLGSDLVVTPVMTPGGSAERYVPAGEWSDVFTGEVQDGPRWETLQGVPLERLPLLARRGSDAESMARTGLAGEG